MIHFLHPQLLWLLLLLPVVAFWLGRKGRVAGVEYSSASVAREVARETRSRVGRLLMLLPLLAAALFIIGLGRTGSTILHDILAQDPANRAPLTWEITYASPPPQTATFETDPRIAKTEAGFPPMDFRREKFKANVGMYW